GATVDNVVLSSFWQDAVGVAISGQSLTKTGPAGWNAGAATVATLSGDGYVQFTTAEATTYKDAVLSHADPAQDLAGIDFALYFMSTGYLLVFEGGTSLGDFGSYSANDVFQIRVSDTYVTYLQNGRVIYQSQHTATVPLLFGATLYTPGATI